MNFFVDTETTGKLDWKKPFNSPGQPRIVSIGGVALSDDGATEVGCFYNIIKPEGFVIDNNSEACKINGITQELAMECGIPIKAAIQQMNHFAYRARYIGIYNAQFDTKMLDGESALLGYTTQLLPAKVRCLKIAYTGICKIPSPNGYSDYKWPKLEEAYRHVYGEDPVGAHNAMVDSRMTGWLAHEAIRQGLFQWEPLQLKDH